MPPIDANVRHPGWQKPAGVSFIYCSKRGHPVTMNRNVLTLLVCVFAVVAVVLGYQLYQERNKTGVAISIGDRGISIEKK
jgi:hypothetical protein